MTHSTGNTQQAVDQDIVAPTDGFCTLVLFHGLKTALLFIRLAAPVAEQGAHRQDNEGHDADHSTDLLVSLYSQVTSRSVLPAVEARLVTGSPPDSR